MVGTPGIVVKAGGFVPTATPAETTAVTVWSKVGSYTGVTGATEGDVVAFRLSGLVAVVTVVKTAPNSVGPADARRGARGMGRRGDGVVSR